MKGHQSETHRSLKLTTRSLCLRHGGGSPFYLSLSLLHAPSVSPIPLLSLGCLSSICLPCPSGPSISLRPLVYLSSVSLLPPLSLFYLPSISLLPLSVPCHLGLADPSSAPRLSLFYLSSMSLLSLYLAGVSLLSLFRFPSVPLSLLYLSSVSLLSHFSISLLPLSCLLTYVWMCPCPYVLCLCVRARRLSCEWSCVSGSVELRLSLAPRVHVSSRC